jgi:hypothetical protein
MTSSSGRVFIDCGNVHAKALVAGPSPEGQAIAQNERRPKVNAEYGQY